MSVVRANSLEMLDGRGKGAITFDSVEELQNSTSVKVGQKVRTLGYHTPGDGGGNDYEIVAGATGTADGGSYIDLAGSGHQAEGFFSSTISINQYGASPSASPSVNGDAFDNIGGLSGIKSIKGTPGVYQTDRDFIVPIHASLDCEGVVISGEDAGPSGFSSSVLIVQGGTDDPLPDLLSNVSAGDIEIEFSTDHNLLSGDDFVIYNPADYSFSGFRDYYRDGEFCTVASVVSSTIVRLEAPLYASHNSANVDLYKLYLSKPGKLRIGVLAPGTGSDQIDGATLNRVGYADITGLNAKGSSDASLVMSNCYRVNGSSVKAIQRGDGPFDTLYGVKFQSSQDCIILGEFSGDRHGSTMTGGDSQYQIPNRNLIVGGIFTRSGTSAPTLTAADWHGNTEKCYYWGTCRGGGINISGDQNKADVIIEANDQNDGICINGREVLGLTHDLHINAICRGGHSTRGAIDIGGGNPDVVTADTVRGGVTKISGSINCPDNDASIIRVRNNGSTAEWIFDVSGLDIAAPNASYHLRVDAHSGNDPYLRTPEWKGTDTIDTDTSSAINSSDITIPWSILADSSNVLYVLNGHQYQLDGVRLVYGVANRSNTGFTAQVSTVDGANFGVATSPRFVWTAQILDK